MGVAATNTVFVRRMEILQNFIFMARNVESVGIVRRRTKRRAWKR